MRRSTLMRALDQSCEMAKGGSGALRLTQIDLLSPLRSLTSHTRYDDVRIDVMQGLLEMLQGGGQGVSGGWEVIIDLITAVPASLAPSQSLGQHDAEGYQDDGSYIADESVREDSVDPNSGEKEWPEAALSIAFSCMELIVDDFLELICSQKETIKTVVGCLSMFSAQSTDVNISLTGEALSVLYFLLLKHVQRLKCFGR